MHVKGETEDEQRERNIVATTAMVFFNHSLISFLIYGILSSTEQENLKF